MTESWRLEDAEERAKNFPYTFYKSSLKVLQKLKKGNQVKLIFMFNNEDPKGPRAERMWVSIEKHKNGIYQDILNNEPIHIKDLFIGDKITFLHSKYNTSK